MKSPKYNLISVGHHCPVPGWHMKEHFHPYHELIVVLRGDFEVDLAGDPLNVSPGDVLWFEKSKPHEEWLMGSSEGETYFMLFDEVKPCDNLRFKLSDHLGRIRMLAKWLYEERQYSISKDSLSNTFFASIIAEYLRLMENTEDSLVRKVQSFMHKRIVERVTLDDIAEHVCVSKYHLIRRYKELTGQTPMADLRNIRVQKARDLILTTTLPLKAIAPRVGLGNEYQLSRLFRCVLGITPGSLRKHNYAKPQPRG